MNHHVWYYLDESKFIAREKGPFTESQLIQLARNGKIKNATLIRSPTRTSNREIRASDIPKLAAIIAEHVNPDLEVERVFLLSWLWDIVTEHKLKRLTRKFHDELLVRKTILGEIRKNPLSGYEVCVQCHWFGSNGNVPEIASIHDISNTATALGGAFFGVGGASAAVGGCVMIVSGLFLLPCCGIGIIPIAIGIAFLLGGSAVGASGTAMTSMARVEAVRDAGRPKSASICPLCHTAQVVSIVHPRGQQLIDANPHLQRNVENALKSRLQFVEQQELLLSRMEVPLNVDSSTEFNIVVGICFGLLGALFGIAAGLLIYF